MLYCSKCFIKKEKYTQIKGTIICHDCVFEDDIKRALRASATKCYECNSPIYDNDSKHEFDKNTSLVAYIFSTSETEKIIRCDRCYKKRKKKEKYLKINKQILFFSATTLLILWLRMLHWKIIKELWNNYPFEFIIFVMISLFSLLVLYLSIFKSWQYKSPNKNKSK